MRLLPPVAQWAMIRDLVITEVVSTNELEGVYSTRRQINEILQSDGPFESSSERKRFRELAKLYLGLNEQERSRPTQLKDIRSIYDKVMDGEPLKENERPDGKNFRRDGVEVIGAGGKVIHEGLFPESAIIDAMERMLAIANSEEMPETLSSIVSHFRSAASTSFGKTVSLSRERKRILKETELPYEISARRTGRRSAA